MPRQLSHLTTTTALLESLKEPGMDSVWAAFDARYRPVIVAFSRRLGLNSTDAEEIAQGTLVEFVSAYRAGRYDRSKGRLRAWIITIARNRITVRWRSQRRAKEDGTDSALEQLGDEAELTRLWAIEQERLIFARAWEMLHTSGRIAENTLRAFELTAIREMPPAAVAAECGMPTDAVHVAKSRVSKRLRELVAQLTTAYGEDP